AILEATGNVKHRAILSVIYSGGLRISECINLQLTDIDSSAMRIWVRNAKGKKDRITLLSPKILQLLRNYYLIYRQKKWLFECTGNKKYSAFSIRNIFNRDKKNVRLGAPETLHTIRHSFATLLL